MPQPSPNQATQPTPDWPTCGLEGNSDRPCTGVRVEGADRCWAHLDPGQLDQALSRLGPGADLDARGTTVTPALLKRVRDAVCGEDGHPKFGRVKFDRAVFESRASFDGAVFEGDTRFDGAVFEGDTRFDGAVFDHVWFKRAVFEDGVQFDGATFKNAARFDKATFELSARFSPATFKDEASFDGATFNGPAVFRQATFEDEASFDKATFRRRAAWFVGVAFEGPAKFSSATFEHKAYFSGATFKHRAEFDEAAFEDLARFNEAAFKDEARFDKATFKHNADFGEATFNGVAGFREAVFNTEERLGPLAAQRLVLSRATFATRVVIEVTGAEVQCARARFEAGLTLRLRQAAADLGLAVFGAPSEIAASLQPFTDKLSSWEAENTPTENTQGALHGQQTTPMLLSLRGTDAAELTVTDVDMTQCRFAGAYHLDKLRMEGGCAFGEPSGRARPRHGWPPIRRWTRRQMLAEECQWRWYDNPAKSVGLPQVPALPADEPLNPKRVAALYRGLRKSAEDSKNEPGAADFYYGEMEMRRADPTTSRAERLLLLLYWLAAGYGLRAGRALVFLATLIGLAALSLHWWGFQAQPELPLCLLYAAQSTVSLESKLSLPGLTFTGEAVRTAMRLLGPLLLGLALLAIRNRVKR